MRLLRKIVFWLHLVVGLVVGLGVAVMAGTGLLLSVERPLVAWAEYADGRRPDAAHGPWGVEELLARARDLGPGGNPTAITIEADPARPVAVAFGRDRRLQLNGYTGEKVGVEAVALRGFFRTVLDTHRWLATTGTWRPAGRGFTAVTVTGFFVLVLSGLWLWFPRRLRWASLKAVAVPRLRGPAKVRDWNWHNVVGFWMLLPLAVTSVTGIVIGQAWASDLVYRAAGDTPPVRREARPDGAQRPGGRERREPGETRPLNVDGLDALWANAEDAERGWTSITMRLGGRRDDGDDAPAEGRGQGGGGGRGVSFAVNFAETDLPTDRVTLTLDRESGGLVRQAFADLPAGRRLRSLVVPTHRGDLLGLPGRVVAGLGCVAALTLVYTGLALSWRRLGRPALARVRGRPTGAATLTAPMVRGSGSLSR